MKLYLLLFLFLLLSITCVYDPPLKGIDVLIENQTDDYIYVTDSLFADRALNFFDTFLINNKVTTYAHGNYVPSYRNWIYFFSDNDYVKMQKDNVNKLCLYFIQKENRGKSYDYIKINRLYKIMCIEIAEIKKHPINHVFYYKDSIVLTHQYDLKTVRIH